MKIISEKELETLKNDAQKVIDAIDINNMNDEDFLALGAALAIINHHVTDIAMSPPTVEQEGVYQMAMEYANCEYNDVKKYLKVGERGIAESSLSHVQYFIEKARGAAHTKEELAAVEELQAKHDSMKRQIDSINQ